MAVITSLDAHLTNVPSLLRIVVNKTFLLRFSQIVFATNCGYLLLSLGKFLDWHWLGCNSLAVGEGVQTAMGHFFFDRNGPAAVFEITLPPLPFTYYSFTCS